MDANGVAVTTASTTALVGITIIIIIIASVVLITTTEVAADSDEWNAAGSICWRRGNVGEQQQSRGMAWHEHV